MPKITRTLAMTAGTTMAVAALGGGIAFASTGTATGPSSETISSADSGANVAQGDQNAPDTTAAPEGTDPAGGPNDQSGAQSGPQNGAETPDASDAGPSAITTGSNTQSVNLTGAHTTADTEQAGQEADGPGGSQAAGDTQQTGDN